MTFPGEGTPSPVFHNIEDQMSKVYVTGVAEVHHPNGKVFKKNRVIPEKEFAVFPPEHRKMLQDKGIVADVSEHVALLTDTVPDNSPTAQTEDEIEALRRELENEKARRQEQSDLPDLPSLSRGTWTVDPSKLEGKTLEQLNVMVQERDQSILPFDTVEEATAQLSFNFQKA